MALRQAAARLTAAEIRFGSSLLPGRGVFGGVACSEACPVNPNELLQVTAKSLGLGLVRHLLSVWKLLAVLLRALEPSLRTFSRCDREDSLHPYQLRPWLSMLSALLGNLRRGAAVFLRRERSP